MGNNSKINFHPWVGENYEEKGFYGRKILVLGDSHYCETADNKNDACRNLGHCATECMNEACHAMTKDVVSDDHIKNGIDNAHKRFEKQFFGKDLTQEERVDFWNSVIFYNFVQLSQDAPRTPLKLEGNEWEALEEVVKNYVPEYIVIWSGERFQKSLKLLKKESKILNREYIIIGENKLQVLSLQFRNSIINALEVWHPSSSKGCPKDGRWHPFYEAFLNIEF